MKRLEWVGDVDQGDQGGPYQQKDVLAKPNWLLMARPRARKEKDRKDEKVINPCVLS